jgi:two-component system, cell cycle response regulator CtrA
VVAAVRGGLLALEEACRRYALNRQEFLSWQCCIDYYGLKGLHTTQIGELNMRVLLIEDDSCTAQSIERILKRERFNVYVTDLGEEGVDLGKLYDFDIVLLDLNLPDMSGFEVLRSLRVCKVKTPILILSALAGLDNKVKGLTYGADDYVTKPFHKDELVARIHAIVRRSKGHAQCVIQTDDLIVNLDTKTVEVNGVQVHLTDKEYRMLELLSLRKGTTLTKETFLNHLYGGMDEPEQKIIDVFICKLRKKLAHASNGKDYFETVWGRGYMLREPTEHNALQRPADLNASVASTHARPAVWNP